MRVFIAVKCIHPSHFSKHLACYTGQIFYRWQKAVTPSSFLFATCVFRRHTFSEWRSILCLSGKRVKHSSCCMVNLAHADGVISAVRPLSCTVKPDVSTVCVCVRLCVRAHWRLEPELYYSAADESPGCEADTSAAPSTLTRLLNKAFDLQQHRRSSPASGYPGCLSVCPSPTSCPPHVSAFQSDWPESSHTKHVRLLVPLKWQNVCLVRLVKVIYKQRADTRMCLKDSLKRLSCCVGFVRSDGQGQQSSNLLNIFPDKSLAQIWAFFLFKDLWMSLNDYAEHLSTGVICVTSDFLICS